MEARKLLFEQTKSLKLEDTNCLLENSCKKKKCCKSYKKKGNPCKKCPKF